MIKTSVQVDWLSISCIGCIENFCGLVCKIENYSTRQFSLIRTIFFETFEFLIITSNPQSGLLNKNLNIIKISNRFLYSEIAKTKIDEILKKNEVKKVLISRIDLCCDFQYFKNLRKPQNLIKNFFSGIIVKKGKSKFTGIGNTDKTIEFEYLRFGQKSSNVNCYLYNKSKELAEVKNKQWIIEFWDKFNFVKNIDIWRLEFSLKNINFSVVDTETGYFEKFDFSNYFDSKILHNLYYRLIDKYFVFYFSGNDSNKTRLKSVELFDKEIVDYCFLKLCNSVESNRMDKFILKKLDLMFSELRSEDIQYKKITELLRDEFMNKKNLQKYYAEKIKPYTDYIKALPQTHGSELLEKNELFDI